MATTARKSSVLSVILPKKKGNGKPVSYTNTYKPTAQGGVVDPPDYRDHLIDIMNTRQANDSRDVLKNLFKMDPDVSAAVSAYLTVADTDPVIMVRDSFGEPSPDGHQLIHDIMLKLNTRLDYTKGYDHRKPFNTLCTEFRHMLLLRGGIGGEAVIDVDTTLASIKNVDMKTVKWTEKQPGIYAPYQEPEGDSNKEINLDIPTFFTAYYRTDPTNVYSDSPWVSVINTVAARQQIVNDLYRIMQITGYPRIVIKVLEEVLTKNMPANVQTDDDARRAWANERFSEIRTAMSNVRPDQAVVTWDSYDFTMLNEKAPGMEMDISPIIEMLNSQNQAALKVMATVIGRGTQGVNTSTVESRIFAMNADQLNKPLAHLFSQIFTLAVRLQGFDGYVTVEFKPAELRPDLELEPQRLIKQNRLLINLSLGTITDLEYHMEMFGRPPPPGSPPLSGTNFNPSGGPDAISIAEAKTSQTSPDGKSVVDEPKRT